MRSAILFALLFVAALPGGATLAPASAAGTGTLRWDIETDRNSFTLSLRQKAERAALPFLAACEENGDLKLTIGAPLDKVQKAGEPVTLKLDAGGKSASLSGKAVYNPFTKVMELVLETNVENPVFSVLATGKPVTVSGPAKTTATWPAANGDAVQQWTTDCQFRSEH